ncbi:MAG: alpha-amylase/4-alpha-glucanotransferase domain-containing protein [Bacteroidota bacterium]
MQFLIALHHHQPVGNFGSVFEEAHRKSYAPFLQLLEKFPSVKVALHYSGILLEWLKQYQSETFSLIKKLVEREQVEMLGGGFYEPILSSIPKRDQIAQLNKLSQFLENNFGKKPRGIWLTERVWEQSLVSSLAESDIEYTMLDDTHFLYAGLSDKQLNGYYLTEFEGVPLKIFPMSKQMRYAIPFHTIEKLQSELIEINANYENNLLLYGDDGEKFGVWPKTYEHVFEKKWLQFFFEMLEENQSWIETKNFSDVIASQKPLGTIYLPTASYAEMLHWALPTDAFVRFEKFEKRLQKQKIFDANSSFVRGGYWKNFSFKYSEVQWLHKRMLELSHQIAENKKNGFDVRTAEENLYAAQCNDVYWHGVFGGLYLPYLRRPVYRHLLEAENNLTSRKQSVIVKDFDLDGSDEIKISSSSIGLYIKPSCGGAIAEIDFFPSMHNLSDVLMRRKEGYHSKVSKAKKEDTDIATIHDSVKAKEDGLKKYLVEDSYQRFSMMDHFFENEISLSKFFSNKHKELGDFVAREYIADTFEYDESINVLCKRDGEIHQQNTTVPLKIHKEVLLSKQEEQFEISYHFTSEQNIFTPLKFGCEWNLALSAGNANDRYFLFNGKKPKDFFLSSRGEEKEISTLSLIDEWLNIRVEFQFKTPVACWRYPIETVSLSEDGFERVYQGTCLVFLWEINTINDWKTSFIVKLGKCL